MEGGENKELRLKKACEGREARSLVQPLFSHKDCRTPPGLRATTALEAPAQQDGRLMLLAKGSVSRVNWYCSLLFILESLSADAEGAYIFISKKINSGTNFIALVFHLLRTSHLERKYIRSRQEINLIQLRNIALPT